jgi:adenine-specific DNA-methyltransferase
MGINYIDSLLASIDDESVRERLTKEVKKLRDDKEFGLVFERHIPEYVRLPKHKITEGATVQIRAEKDDEIYSVRSIQKKQVTIVDSNDEAKTMATKDLIIVSRHGDLIPPGLTEVDRIERGGDKPFHTVINAENYHALQLLLYTHEGKVDCIYIDPPYNTGAKDWKYNNDYVDSEDRYRHSKWLSFMEKRLKLGKRLMNNNNSVLIVTIDEKEYLRLGLLLEQIFPNSNIQMITSLINPKGVARGQEFYRVEEYIFFVFLGDSTLIKNHDAMIATGNMTEDGEIEQAGEKSVRWGALLRSGTDAMRSDRKNQFYPIFLERESGDIVSIGEPLLPVTRSRDTIDVPEGTVAIWPIRSDDSEGRWAVGYEELRNKVSRGHVKRGRYIRDQSRVSFSYITENLQKLIQSGEIIISENEDNSVELNYADDAIHTKNPKTMWNRSSHSAGDYGSSLLRDIIPGRKFPFPKSLYAVEDALRFVVKENKSSLILDFFAGSGTTCHAVMRLNKQDEGRRISISVTNNEIGEKNEEQMKKSGYVASDPEWQQLGIFNYITMPRIINAVNGSDSDGTELTGEYKFTDIAPYSIGFEENIKFLTLDYLDNDNVIRNKSFNSISTILWMISGSVGSVIEEVSETFELQPEGRYGILFDITHWQEFVDAVKEVPTMTHVFIITDSKVQYQQIVNHLPTNICATMLYEDYLRNFQIGV